MELTVVRHLSKEIEAGNGAWAVLVANEQLGHKHPLRRAFIFKARQLSRMSDNLSAALTEGQRLSDLSPRLRREVMRSKFGFKARKQKPVVSLQGLVSRNQRITNCRGIEGRNTMRRLKKNALA